MINRIYLKYKEVILYLIFGGLTTLVNILSYAIFTQFINWQVSNILSWILSVLFAYITNRKFVFKSQTTSIIKEMISFFSFRILSLCLDMAFMLIFIDIININNMLAKVIVQVLVIILNYVFSKVFIFKKRGELYE
jgi:putative flippase GtrA